MTYTDAPKPPAIGVPVDRTVGRLVPEGATAGLLAQIDKCRREVAGWPEHMRVVAVLRIHPAAMDDANVMVSCCAAGRSI